MANYIIETRALHKRFGKKVAIQSLNLKIAQGGIHAVIGANGAGKSTLFRILLGLDAPTSGESFILGHNSQSLEPEHRGRIGYVNEEHTLPTWMKVHEVTAMQKNLYKNWRQDLYDSVIGNFNVEQSQKVSALSRGERAGLNLAMALAQAPEVLILDEPTLGLDVVAKQAFLEALMFTQADIDTTIVYCSHQMEEIERVAEQLIVIENGEMKYNECPEKFCDMVTYWIFDEALSESQLSTLGNVLSARIIDEQTHLVLADLEAAEALEKLNALGIEAATQAPVSLDKAIASILAKNHRAPQ